VRTATPSSKSCGVSIRLSPPSTQGPHGSARDFGHVARNDSSFFVSRFRFRLSTRSRNSATRSAGPNSRVLARRSQRQSQRRHRRGRRGTQGSAERRQRRLAGAAYSYAIKRRHSAAPRCNASGSRATIFKCSTGRDFSAGIRLLIE